MNITKRDWWIGVALVSLAIVVHAAVPRFDWRGSGERLPLRVWIEASTTYKNVDIRVVGQFDSGAATDVLAGQR